MIASRKHQLAVGLLIALALLSAFSWSQLAEWRAMAAVWQDIRAQNGRWADIWWLPRETDSDKVIWPTGIAELEAQNPKFIVLDQSTNSQLLAQTGWFQHTYHQKIEYSSGYELWDKQPSILEEVESLPLTVDINNQFDLTGYRAAPFIVPAGNPIHLELDFQSESESESESELSVEQSFNTIVQLISPTDGDTIANWEQPSPLSRPLNWWLPGDPLTESIILTTTQTAEPGAYLLQVAFRPENSLERWQLYKNGDPNPLDRITLTTVTVPWEGEIPVDASPINANFNDQIELTALLLEAADPIAAGQSLPMTIYWSSQANISLDFIVFVHLLDSEGNWVAGDDRRPANGRFITTSWQPGLRIPDPHVIQLPPDLPAGQYTLKAGLYRPENGARFPVSDAAGNVLGDAAVTLTQIDIK